MDKEFDPFGLALAIVFIIFGSGLLLFAWHKVEDATFQLLLGIPGGLLLAIGVLGIVVELSRAHGD